MQFNLKLVWQVEDVADVELADVLTAEEIFLSKVAPVADVLAAVVAAVAAVAAVVNFFTQP